MPSGAAPGGRPSARRPRKVAGSGSRARVEREADAPSPAPSTTPSPGAAPLTPAAPSPGTSRRVARALLHPHARRVDLAVAALLLLLGFALVVQVRSTRNDGPLTNARQEDLIAILDDLDNRSDRLRQEIGALSDSKAQLTSGDGQSAAALAEARRRTQVLGVVAGTVPARGVGILVTIADPGTQVSASLLLDALEELRNAGAEAMQIDGGGRSVRIVAQTALVDDPEGVVVDGTLLTAPYRFRVIGDPATLAGALAIPGGVEDTVRQRGGSVSVERPDRVSVTALRPLTTPRYARPS
jgi:uncharacterized protein YlxW (UPF0749 family)